MALMYSPSAELGSPLPTFRLKSVDGKIYSSGDFSSAKAFLVMFICNHCPYVKAIEERILQLARDLQPKGLAMVAICSNDPTDYPEDEPAQLLKRWSEKNYGFPYLVDEDQTVAKAFAAVCTPDIFLYDAAQRLSYRGRFDDSWKDAGKVQKQELRLACEALLGGRTPQADQTPTMGCSIKWKSN